MFRAMHPEARTAEEIMDGLEQTYRYYIDKYPQKRFKGLTSKEVREAAFCSDHPEQYPIPKNPYIEKYWEEIEKKKGNKRPQTC